MNETRKPGYALLVEVTEQMIAGRRDEQERLRGEIEALETTLRIIRPLGEEQWPGRQPEPRKAEPNARQKRTCATCGGYATSKRHREQCLTPKRQEEPVSQDEPAPSGDPPLVRHGGKRVCVRCGHNGGSLAHRTACLEPMSQDAPAPVAQEPGPVVDLPEPAVPLPPSADEPAPSSATPPSEPLRQQGDCQVDGCKSRNWMEGFCRAHFNMGHRRNPLRKPKLTCPRCQGQLMRDRDEDGPRLSCLQCGHVVHEVDPREALAGVLDGEKRPKRRGASHGGLRL